MFKVIIAGSRSWTDYDELKKKCDYLLSEKIKNGEKIIIISGHASGADQLGEKYAKERNLECVIIPADWDKYGKQAGMIRNEQMAKVADACIAFFSAYSENKGTSNMVWIARKYKLQVREIKEEE